ncbi:MAG: hypothetical protein AAFQ02_10535 [Bacteroidota bacterium]
MKISSKAATNLGIAASYLFLMGFLVAMDTPQDDLLVIFILFSSIAAATMWTSDDRCRDSTGSSQKRG